MPDGKGGFQINKSVEQIYEEAKELIGVETETILGRYPVEYEPIRRYCHMVDDANPLFLDPDYAKNTKYGGVICPPFMVQNFGLFDPWPPKEKPSLPSIPALGRRAINMATEWEFFKPVRIGDLISCKRKIVDIYIKPVRLDPKTFWIITEDTYTNQHGETVAILRNTMLRYRTAEQIKQAGD